MKIRHVALAFVGLVFAAHAAFAQGGGAGQTGVITGKVTDTTGSVLPGVTVSLASPALISAQDTISNDGGNYRFPSVPPGVYTVTFMLAGFNTLRQENVGVSLGFTATVNAQLRVATLEESITVVADSRLIDATATRVQQNFKLEQLENLPSGRDWYSLLAVTPATAMARIDVGGNRAGVQTGYIAYGFGTQVGQTRNMVEGIDITNGGGSTGLFLDYGAFEEVFVGTVGQGAELAAAGVNSQFLMKSGGDRFSGEAYLDWYNNSLQGANLPDEYLRASAFGGSPLRPHSNEIDRYMDVNVNGGGPLLRDRTWWFGSFRRQGNSVESVNFLFDKTSDLVVWNPSAKVTHQINPRQRLIGYFQWGQKGQPNRVWNASYVYGSPGDTLKQDSGTWVWKGEWNGSLTNNLHLEARYGQFGFYFPSVGYSDEPFRQDVGTRTSQGGDRRNQLDTRRHQATLALNYVAEKAGTHTLRGGFDVNLEEASSGNERTRANDIEHIFNNGTPFRVVLGFPTARGTVGHRGADLLSTSSTDMISGFVADQWAIGRSTLSLGVRLERHTARVPEQEQIASSKGPITLTAQTFPAATYAVWNTVAPRVGISRDLQGDGRTVVKAAYGYFGHTPAGLSGAANPNNANKTVTYTWNDSNGDRLYQTGEEGQLVASNLAGTTKIDPSISQPYSQEGLVYLERQIAGDISVRTGFVYKTTDNLWQAVQPGRPFGEYTTPFSVLDIGADGLEGTPDDRTLTLLAIPRANLASLPADVVIDNVDGKGRYKTIEATVSKRLSHRWSATIGFAHTWSREGNDQSNGSPNSPGNQISFAVPGSRSWVNLTPNDTTLQDFTFWSLKMFGTYNAPWGLQVTPTYRHQSGSNYGRTLTVSAPAAVGLYSATILAEPLDARRMDNIHVVDVRVGKALPFAAGQLHLLFDAFNLTNSHAADVISYGTGLGFQRPGNVIAPRTGRIGVKFAW